jgi:uncharacterized protein YndB with AHSA1/START domain
MATPVPLNITLPNDQEVLIKRTFNAARQLVFNAYTQPKLVRRWMLGPPGWTFVVCEIDLRVSGIYRFAWTGPEGELAMSGVYREIAPPERLVSSELFDQDWTGGETLSTLLLSEDDGITTLTQTIRYSSREARDAALQTGMEHGMAASFSRLDELVSTGDA